jgi:hypothetical protein
MMFIMHIRYLLLFSINKNVTKNPIVTSFNVWLLIFELWNLYNGEGRRAENLEPGQVFNN